MNENLLLMMLPSDAGLHFFISQFILTVMTLRKSLLQTISALCVTDAYVYKATMTAYGSKDIKHSGNCKEKKACGFYFDVSPHWMLTGHLITNKIHSPATLLPSPRTSMAWVLGRELDQRAAGATS